VFDEQVDAVLKEAWRSRRSVTSNVYRSRDQEHVYFLVQSVPITDLVGDLI